MRVTSSNNSIISQQSIEEFFFDSVNSAARNQHLDASDDTKHYLVKLLTTFSRSEQLFDYTEQGVSLKPLALRYFDALSEFTASERLRILQKLGDTALFISGVLPNSLNRKMIDVDYYIAMGGNAYSYLSDNVRDHYRQSSAHNIFSELTSRFVDFVDVLAEVSEKISMTRDHDILRLYEVWMRTGSKRTRALLQRLGIDPVSQILPDFRH